MTQTEPQPIPNIVLDYDETPQRPSESPAPNGMASRSSSVRSCDSTQRGLRSQISFSDVLLMDVVTVGGGGDIHLTEISPGTRDTYLIDPDVRTTLPRSLVAQIDAVGIILYDLDVTAAADGARKVLLNVPASSIQRIYTADRSSNDQEATASVFAYGLAMWGHDGFGIILSFRTPQLRAVIHKITAARTGVLIPRKSDPAKRSQSARAPTRSETPSAAPSTFQARAHQMRSPSAPVRPNSRSINPGFSGRTTTPSRATPTKKDLTPKRGDSVSVPSQLVPRGAVPEERAARRAELVAQVTEHRKIVYTPNRETQGKNTSAEDRRLAMQNKLEKERMKRTQLSDASKK